MTSLLPPHAQQESSFLRPDMRDKPPGCTVCPKQNEFFGNLLLAALQDRSGWRLLDGAALGARYVVVVRTSRSYFGTQCAELLTLSRKPHSDLRKENVSYNLVFISNNQI